MAGVVSSATIGKVFGESSVFPLSGWLCLLRSDLPAKEVLKALRPSFNKGDPVFIFEASPILSCFCTQEIRDAAARFLSEPEEDQTAFFSIT